MEEFSDKFLKDLFDKKSGEFDPNDDLQMEWENIDRAIHPSYFNWVKVLASAVILLLFFTPMALHDAQEHSGYQEKYEDKALHSIEIADYNSASTGKVKQSSSIVGHGEVIEKKSPAAAKKSVENINVHNYSEKAFTKDLKTTREIQSPNTIQSLAYQNLAALPAMMPLFGVNTNEEQQVTQDDSNEDDKKDKKLNLYVGSFYNFNHFTPNGYDDFYITSFEQSKNPFNNRLGLQLSVEFKDFKTFIGRVRPTLGYSILNKKFSYKRGDVYYESSDQMEKVAVNSLNQFVMLGTKLITERNYMVGINFQYNLAQHDNKDQMVFTKSLLLMEIAKEFEIENQSKSFTFRPYIQYGIPIKEKLYYKTYPINIGVAVKIF